MNGFSSVASSDADALQNPQKRHAHTEGNVRCRQLIASLCCVAVGVSAVSWLSSLGAPC